MRKFLPKIFFTVTIIGGALALSLFLSGKEINSLSSSILAPGATAIPTTLVPTGTMSPDVTESPMTTTEDPDWYTGPWSSCIAGKRTRIVECRSGNTVISETLCSTPRPKDQEIYSVSGPASVSFQEASGPATYKITLSGPSDSDAKIISVKATSEPKHTTAINYKHPADGSGKGVPWMTWTTQNISSNGQSAVIRSDDYAWYGIPGDDGSMPDNLPPGIVGLSPQNFQYPKLGYLSNKQSVYVVGLTIALDNNCTLQSTIDMYVQFADVTNNRDRSEARIYFKQTKTVGSIIAPLKTLVKFRPIYHTCISADDLEINEIKTSEVIKMLGQYRQGVIDEEKFHSRQARGEVGWDQGGNAGLYPVLKEIFVETKYCAYGFSSDDSLKKAYLRFTQAHESVMNYFASDFENALNAFVLDSNLDNHSEDLKRSYLLRCWVEKKAKEYAGLTSQKYGGLILEHAYPGCKQDMEQPESLVEILRSEIDYFRGFVKDEIKA